MPVNYNTDTPAPHICRACGSSSATHGEWAAHMHTEHASAPSLYCATECGSLAVFSQPYFDAEGTLHEAAWVAQADASLTTERTDYTP